MYPGGGALAHTHLAQRGGAEGGEESTPEAAAVGEVLVDAALGVGLGPSTLDGRQLEGLEPRRRPGHGGPEPGAVLGPGLSSPRETRRKGHEGE